MTAFSTRHCSKSITQQPSVAGTIIILIFQLQTLRPLCSLPLEIGGTKQ